MGCFVFRNQSLARGSFRDDQRGVYEGRCFSNRPSARQESFRNGSISRPVDLEIKLNRFPFAMSESPCKHLNASLGIC
jgi:hypothetical protein